MLLYKKSLFHIFLVSSSGSLAQKLYFIGLAWVSATFATSIYNLVPVPPLSSPFCAGTYVVTTAIYLLLFFGT